MVDFNQIDRLSNHQKIRIETKKKEDEEEERKRKRKTVTSFFFSFSFPVSPSLSLQLTFFLFNSPFPSSHLLAWEWGFGVRFVWGRSTRPAHRIPATIKQCWSSRILTGKPYLLKGQTVTLVVHFARKMLSRCFPIPSAWLHTFEEAIRARKSLRWTMKALKWAPLPNPLLLQLLPHVEQPDFKFLMKRIMRKKNQLRAATTGSFFSFFLF